MMRPGTSVVPPGESGMTLRTGCAGYPWAATAAENRPPHAAATRRIAISFRCLDFSSCPWGPRLPAVYRFRLREERVQDVIHREVILLLETRVRDPGHYGELLVRIGQPLEEFDQIVDPGDAVPLTPHDEGGRADFRRIDDRQVRTHVHIRSRRHGIV